MITLKYRYLSWNQNRRKIDVYNFQSQDLGKFLNYLTFDYRPIPIMNIDSFDSILKLESIKNWNQTIPNEYVCSETRVTYISSVRLKFNECSPGVNEFESRKLYLTLHITILIDIYTYIHSFKIIRTHIWVNFFFQTPIRFLI